MNITLIIYFDIFVIKIFMYFISILMFTLKFYFYNLQIETKKKTGVLDKIINIYLQYLKWYLYPENKAYLNNMNNRTVWQYFKYKEIKYDESLNTICLQWPIDVIINIGKFLYKIILNDIMLQPEILKGQDIKHSIPAFYTLFRNKGNYLSEQVCICKLNIEIFEILQHLILLFENIRFIFILFITTYFYIIIFILF